jgi:phosphoglycerol transferase MdoB-like AlkP superfamily enzyme
MNTDKKIIIFTLLILSVLFFAEPALAQDYEPLEPLPNLNEDGENPGIAGLLRYAFRILFTIGGVVAVFALILGGITYMVSEAVGKKDEAKKRIQAAVWGLLLLAVSVLILQTINPQLLQFNFNLPNTQPPTTQKQTTNNPASGSDGNNVKQDAETLRLYTNFFDEELNQFIPSEETNSQLDFFNRTQCNGRGVHATDKDSDNLGEYTLYSCIAQ